MSVTERPLLPHVDIRTPDYEAMGFILGLSRLGDLFGPDPDYTKMGFILGVSVLGDRFAEPPVPVSRWRTWIRNATDIRIKRGFVRRGIGLRTDVGIMTFTLHNDQDPMRGGAFQPGQIVRAVQHAFGGKEAALFTGTVTDVKGTYVLDKQTGDLVRGTVVTASDAVLTHTQTKRYGVRVTGGSEIFEDRIARLEATSRIPVLVPPKMNDQGAYPQRLRSTVYESSLANHFDLACNSVGAAWYADVNNITRFTTPASSQPVSAVFSDKARDGALLYVDIDAGYDTASLVNTLEITNHGIGEDGLADDEESTVTRPESVSLYGPRAEDIAVNIHVPDPQPTPDSGEIISERRNLWSDPIPTSATAEDGVYRWARDNNGTPPVIVEGGSTYIEADKDYPTDSVARSGNWSLRGVRLGPGVYTLSQGVERRGSLRPPRMRIFMFNTDGQIVSDIWITPVEIGDTRLAWTFTVPANAERVYFNPRTNAAIRKGDWWRFTLPLLERGTIATTPFHGDMPTGPSGEFYDSYTWDGPRGASSSTHIRRRRVIAPLADRVNSVLDAGSEPRLLVRSVTWNAQQNITAAPSLELAQRVHVLFDGTVQDSRLIGLDHDITPTRWMITARLATL